VQNTTIYAVSTYYAGTFIRIVRFYNIVLAFFSSIKTAFSYKSRSEGQYLLILENPI